MLTYLSFCLCVCEHIFGTTCQIFTKFLCVLPVSMVQFSSDCVAVCYVLPVLLIMSYLHIMAICRGAGVTLEQAA